MYGTGIIGLLTIQLALLRGGRVAAYDISEPRLAIARKLGATQAFSSVADLEKEFGSFHVVFETSGTAEDRPYCRAHSALHPCLLPRRLDSGTHLTHRSKSDTF